MNMGGYAAIPRTILHCPTLSGHGKLAYVALSSFVGADARAWPSLQRLCTITGLSQSSVQRALRDLRSHGFLSWTRDRKSDGTWGPTYYRLNQPVVTVTSGATSGQEPVVSVTT